MTANHALTGRAYAPTSPRTVSRTKIREHADAVGASSPLHTDVEAARAAGYGDVVAAPTFLAAFVHESEAAAALDPDLGLDLSNAVHGEVSFVHHRPVQAGDELVAVTRVTGVDQRADATDVSFATDVSDLSSDMWCETSSTMTVRRGPS